MVALNDLKRNSWVVAPWYKKEAIEFRIENEDLTFTIEGGGTQRRISICFRIARIPLSLGLLIHTVPKRGAASIFVAKGLTLPSPKEGSENLGDALTFTHGKSGQPCTAADHLRHLQLGNHSIDQRLYTMPHDNSILLAERHRPSRGKPFTSYYQVIQVDEKELRRK